MPASQAPVSHKPSPAQPGPPKPNQATHLATPTGSPSHQAPTQLGSHLSWRRSSRGAPTGPPPPAPPGGRRSAAAPPSAAPSPAASPAPSAAAAPPPRAWRLLPPPPPPPLSSWQPTAPSLCPGAPARGAAAAPARRRGAGRAAGTGAGGGTSVRAGGKPLATVASDDPWQPASTQPLPAQRHPAPTQRQPTHPPRPLAAAGACPPPQTRRQSWCACPGGRSAAQHP